MSISSSEMDRKKKYLSKDDYQSILAAYLKTNDFIIGNCNIVPLSNTIEGFLGEHFKVIIEYQRNQSAGTKTLRFFMKVQDNSMKTILAITKSLNAYEKEKFFYHTLINEFRQYDINIYFCPHGYFYKPNVIVLQDMSVRGYKSVKKNTFFDLPHCQIALKTISQFHASSLLYEYIKSIETGREFSLKKLYASNLQEMLFSSASKSLAKDWFKYSLDGVLQIIELIPENHVTNENFAQKLREFVASSINLFDTLSKYKGTILHGDLWNNNLLFKYFNKTPVESTLLDYQLLKFGPPSVDVLHFIYANTRKEFRDMFFCELIEYYYMCLKQSTMSKFNVNDVLPKTEYLQLCGELKTIVKLQCICDRCVTLTPEELLQETVHSDEDLHRYLFEDRAKIIVNCFKGCSLYREVIEEDLLELRELLFKDN